MRKGIEERCVQVGRYLFENSSTVRATAKEFQMSKTTVHKDLVIRLPRVHPQLAKRCRKYLQLTKGSGVLEEEMRQEKIPVF